MGSPEPGNGPWRLVLEVRLTQACGAVPQHWEGLEKQVPSVSRLSACCGLCCCGRYANLHAFGKVETLSLDPD